MISKRKPNDGQGRPILTAVSFLSCRFECSLGSTVVLFLRFSFILFIIAGFQKLDAELSPVTRIISLQRKTRAYVVSL